MVAVPILYLTMGSSADTTVITACALSIAFLSHAGTGPLLVFLNERFPTNLRASGTALS